MNELTPVRLRGLLGARFGTAPRLLAVSSPKEAISLLCATVPGFLESVRDSEIPFAILVKNVPINPEEDLGKSTGGKEIRIVPWVHGAKDGMTQVVVGAVLIVLAVCGQGWLAATWGKVGTAIDTAMFSAGVMTTIGGISRLLTGTPDGPKTNGGNSSELFSSTPNSAGQGTPVPVLYGEFMAEPPRVSVAMETASWSYGMFNGTYDGSGAWSGDGSATPWGASISPVV
jgi:predicted phage tail protein